MADPFLVGLYEDNRLIKRIEGKGKISDEFPLIYKKLIQEYELKRVYFVNGPGSYMSIKLIYLFLQTIALSDEVEIYSALGFEFNNNQPIKALGNRYFIQKDGTIELQTFQDKIAQLYRLPEVLDTTLFSSDLEPVYILPSVH
jgi:hypothetical protein